MCRLSVYKRDYILPTGQSSIIAGRRIEELINELLKLNLKKIVLISHGGVIGDYLRNVFSDKVIQSLSESFLKKLQVDSCSITIVEYENGIFAFKKLDSVSHLKS